MFYLNKKLINKNKIKRHNTEKTPLEIHLTF